MPTAEVLHFSSTLFMTGLIWVIQLVHYPSFHFVQQDKFKDFENFHAQRISFLVLPAMLLELFTGAYLVWSHEFSLFYVINIFLLVLTWLVTLAVSSRLHSQLSAGYNQGVVDRLIKTNWCRTFLWSVRSLILLKVFL